MAKAYSLDLRERVLEAVAEGLSPRQAAEGFRVSEDSIADWRQLVREKGSAQHRPLGGDRRSGRIESEHDTIPGLLAENPDFSVEALRAALRARGLVFGYGAVYRFLKRHGFKRWRNRNWSKPRSRQRRAARTS